MLVCCLFIVVVIGFGIAFVLAADIVTLTMINGLSRKCVKLMR